MTMRGKSIRNGIIIGMLCIALVVAYFVITANETPAAKGVLYTLGNDHISTIRIKNTYGDYSFYKDGDDWVVESDGVYRTNPEKIQLLLGCLEQFSINRMLTDEKSEYGFETPQAQVWVKTAGGDAYQFLVGNDAISGSSVYIRSGDDIMLTSTAMTSQLTGSLAAYRAKKVLMVDPSQIRSIEYFVNGEQTLLLTNTDYFNWKMGAPFRAPARNVIVNELIAKLRSLSIAGYIDSTSAVSNMGLEAPTIRMILVDQEGITQTLEFGSVLDTVQFVRIGAESDIVQLYVSDLDFKDLTPEGVMYVAPLDISIDLVQSVSIKTGGAEDLLVLDRSGAVISATLNGKPVDYAETFVSIYFKCITINADGYDTPPPAQGEREATITVTKTNGETVELSLYHRDEDTLYLYLNGEPIRSGDTIFYSDARSLTELIYRLQGASD